MKKILQRHWQARTFARHNAYCREKGYHAAILSPTPWRKFLPLFLRGVRDELRERLAFKIAPWVKPEDYE